MLSPDAAFEQQIAKVKLEEGGYSDDPNDPGGVTNFGWTERSARENGYTGDMKAMTWDQAVALYKTVFWHETQLDLLCVTDDTIAMKLLDSSINVGADEAISWLQKALNALSDGGKTYSRIGVDGVCGSHTRSAIRALIKARGNQARTVLLEVIRAYQVVYYIDLEDGNSALAENGYGWEVRATEG